MGFYFCGRYIYNDGDEKKVEWDMYAAMSCFRGSHDRDGYEKSESNLEAFSYFVLAFEQKCRYAQMRLVIEAYWWWKDNHSSYRYWLSCKTYFVFSMLCTFSSLSFGRL